MFHWNKTAEVYNRQNINIAFEMAVSFHLFFSKVTGSKSLISFPTAAFFE
ncbi:hypothetical protein [Paenibacillus planticolens]|nr:hypothetical protein [Paenibacillus planticolens]